MAEPTPPAAQTLTMYNPQTGEPVQVDAKEAGALFRTGRATFAADQDVPVVGPSGRVEVLKGDAAGQYFQSAAGLAGGASTPEALRVQTTQDTYGGAGSTALAGLAGVARGATIGISDALLTGTGLVAPSTLAGLQEANPITSGVGEVAGIIAPALVTGGESLIAKGALSGGAKVAARGALTAAEVATAPARGLMAAGRAVEGGVTGLLGEGRLASFAASSASAATEGALFGVGQAVSEASIKDIDLTADRIIAAAGHGALLGGAVGGGVSVAGGLLRGIAGKVADGAEGLMTRFGQGEAKLGAELAESAAPKTQTTLKALVDGFGREQALKATGGTAGQVQRLQAMGRDVEDRVIKRLLDDAPEALGKKAGSVLSSTEKAAAAAKMVERDAERVGSLVDDLAKSGEKANVSGVVERAREQITGDMLKTVNPGAKSAAGAVDDWLVSLEKAVPDGDVKKLWSARQELHADIDWHKTPGADRLTDWKRGLLEGVDAEIKAVGERAAPAVGPDFAARWSTAQTDAQASMWLKEATVEGAAADARNRITGLADGLLQNLGRGGIAGAPAALAATVVQNLVRQYGSDVAAQLARAVTKGETVHAIDQAVERIAGERVAALVGGVKRTVQELPNAVSPLAVAIDGDVRRERDREPKTQSLSARYTAARKELTASLPMVTARAQAAAEGLDQVAPGLGAAVAARVISGATFLQSKLPQVTQRASLQPGLERERQPPLEEQAKFLRYAKAVNDPLSVLEDARQGRLRKEGVEALQAVYPSMYQALQASVSSAVAEKKDRLSYAQRIQLGMLLDLPTDPSLKPEAIRFYQQIQQQVTPPNQAPTAGPGPMVKGPKPKALKPMKLPSFSTRSDRFGA